VLCKLGAACRRRAFYVRANVKEHSREYSPRVFAPVLATNTRASVKEA